MRSYMIATWDDRCFTIDETIAPKLIETWTNADKPFPVDLGTEAISSSLIKSITPNQLTEADRPTAWADDAKMLMAGNQCRGQYSIQLEINRIARGEGGPKGFAGLIRDRQWREKTRRMLLQTTNEWCDVKSGACACEASYKSYAKRHQV